MIIDALREIAGKESDGAAAMTAAPDVDGAGAVELLARYRAARDRLRRGVELLSLALDLRERLYWGCFDLDAARAEVAAFKYACAAHRWWRRSQ
jgi:hypothetical protein